MTRALRPALQLALVLFSVSGCGALDDGPGSDGTFVVSIDGEPQSFNEGVNAELVTGQNTVEISISGASDPNPSTVDDESTLVLELELDRSALDRLRPAATLQVDGVTTFPPTDATGRFEEPFVVTFEPREGNDPAITGLSLVQSCRCVLPAETTITQAFSGSVTFRELDADNLELTTDLTMTGRIPFAQTDSTSQTRLEATVVLDAP